MLGDTPAVRATLAALMETGIRVSDVEIVRLTPGFTLDDRLQRFMETAARLGAGQVLVAGNDDNLQRSADNLAILAAAGRPFGLTMNLEPMPSDPVAQHRRSASTNRRQRAGKTSAFWWTLSISGARENRSPPSPACPRIISTICNSAMARRRGRRASRNLSARPLGAQRAGGRRSGSAWSDVGPAGDAAGLSKCRLTASKAPCRLFSGRSYCSMPRSPTCTPAHKEYAMTQTQRLDVRELINRNPLSRFQKLIIFLGFCVIALDGFDIAIMGFIAPTLKLEWG